jgi:hypothetical protein
MHDDNTVTWRRIYITAIRRFICLLKSFSLWSGRYLLSNRLSHQILPAVILMGQGQRKKIERKDWPMRAVRTRLVKKEIARNTRDASAPRVSSTLSFDWEMLVEIPFPSRISVTMPNTVPTFTAWLLWSREERPYSPRFAAHKIAGPTIMDFLGLQRIVQRHNYTNH